MCECVVNKIIQNVLNADDDTRALLSIISIIALVAGGGITCKVTRGCSEPHSTYY